ncbi:DNA primase family protein [Variovorax sp. RA8]|jgi:putative DNA primase/helicase|uniref:DNA primase family protein n=1 Tax=Variovorax sp. (strain JCM 16519 / RA8) TaxID=662548 RepID=UPI000ACEAFDD|nr:phage/plasmid primase, P4 family [Variovorax sp. RA8]VTU34649.1 hypothetical protein RA8CHR_05015 [Variovorax sp. RA8]
MNNTDNNEIVNTVDDKYVDDQFGVPPGNETLDETDTLYLTIDDDGKFLPFHQNSEDSIEQDQEDEITKFLSVDKLPEFARMKLAAKKAKNKERLAELIELEKAYKQEVAAKEKEQKAKARDDQKAAEAFFKKQEKLEAEAKKAKERNADLAHKAHMAALASDEPTPELVYAKTVGAMPNLAVDVRDENVALYEWAESYWKLLTKHEGRKRAFEWLEENFPNMAGNKLAGNAYESALFKSQSLPPRPKESIIPMLNAWLFVTDEGNLLLKKPDKAWGVTYNIKAALKFKEGSRFYVPKPLPPESRFYKFITSSLPDEKERMLVQEYCGYTLTNNVKHQVAQIWEGSGSNGKSVLLEIIEKLHENAVAVNLDKLDGPEMASLKDASLAISAETPKGKLNENELKKFIAGDLVSLRNLYERAFDHHPTAKWIMSCNRFPRIQDETDAVFRRLQYIRWDVKFEGDAIIPDLHKLIIENELDLVVDWCLEGLLRLNKRTKFDPPETVKARLQEEKIASNTVLAYVTDMGYRIDPVSCNISKNDFYKKYQEWCEESNLTLFGGTEFWKRMNALFPDMRDPQKTVKGKRMRFINLTNTPLEDIKAEQDEIDNAFGNEESNKDVNEILTLNIPVKK